MGIGVAILVPAAGLMVRLKEPSDNRKQIIASIVILCLLAYAVLQYGGLKLGHGHNQGGKLGLQPRTVRRLWIVGEYYTGASAFLTAIGSVVLPAALILGWAAANLWVLSVFNFFVCLSMFWIWRLVRDRRQRLYPRG